jgi:fermentation-respiration switch protein FrsA (DUF1100 family)
MFQASPPRGAARQASAVLDTAGGRIARRLRTLVIGVVLVISLLLLALGVVGWIGSERAIHPGRQEVRHRLADYPFAALAEAVRFPSLDGTPLAGWFIPAGRPGAATIILLHGFGASRAQMLPHAAYLHDAGYHVLLFDFRNRGESGGDAVTLGAREPLDVRGAVSYVLTRPDVDPARIAVQGIGLGAVAGILAMAADPRIKAIVAEGAFTDLDGAISRNFQSYIGLPPVPFAPITVYIVERRLGARASDVRPIDAIKMVGRRPVFIIDARDDPANPPESGRRLYEAAPGPKDLWVIEGGGHAGGFDEQPDEYARRVLQFYTTYLVSRATGSVP